MIWGIVLFVIALVLIGYACGCWMPGNESRKEEKEDAKNKDGEEC